MTSNRVVLLSFEDAVASVTALLNNAIRPEVFWLHDGEYEARLTVDPDVAQAALRRYYEPSCNAVTAVR